MKNQEHYKIVGVFILVLFALGYFFELKWLTYIALFTGVASFTFERFAILFADLWMKFGKLLGHINAGIILSLVFFLIVTPIRFLKQLFAKKNTTNTCSTWVNTEEETVNFDKPW